MTCPSWVAIHGMAYSFIELDKVVVHEIRLVSFTYSVNKYLSSIYYILGIILRDEDLALTKIPNYHNGVYISMEEDRMIENKGMNE